MIKIGVVVLLERNYYYFLLSCRLWWLYGWLL